MKERQYPPAPEQVYLYGTCLVDLFVPQAGLDTVRLLEREGLTVHFPHGQSCCGQPAYTSGNPDQARAVARAQLDLFAQPWPVIVPSGSCATTGRNCSKLTRLPDRRRVGWLSASTSSANSCCAC